MAIKKHQLADVKVSIEAVTLKYQDGFSSSLVFCINTR